ncbi:hypothetical protein CBS101457_006432 [Exobasidium rhododendri]|nr:hypothetical protein CBS101457_006432 [Exobasidium rhododendri]
MVSFTSIFVSAVVVALSSTGSNALPVASLDRRVVGTLSCKAVKTGKLQLYNTKTNVTQGATFANNYRLDDALDGAKRPSSLEGEGNPRLLSSYSGVKGESLQFLACTESQEHGFEDYAPEINGTYYGHLSPTKSSSYCATHVVVYADTAYLASEKCNYSDDSGSPFSYFSYDPTNNGKISFLDNTGPKGGIPQSSEGTFDFGPGSSKKHPAVYVHEGSADFSDWELRLV